METTIAFLEEVHVRIVSHYVAGDIDLPTYYELIRHLYHVHQELQEASK